MLQVQEQNLAAMLSDLGISGADADNMKREAELFPVRVPDYYFNLINKDDPDDPIRKLCLPTGQFALDGGALDTSGEHGNTVLQGLQHKYDQTALVLCSGECAMYCRHCFRRRLAGKATDEVTADVQAVARYVREHPSITNVLLSGGDALMLPTPKIAEWLAALSCIETLDFIRIGSRIPVSLPARITQDAALLSILQATSAEKQLYLVTHFNHPNEITEGAIAAVRALQGAGVVVKNQTVLLRGVNDTPDVLGALLAAMTRYGIGQHYIFQCRPVQGVKSIFQVPLKEGRAIVDAAMNRQNGLGKSAEYTMSHVTGKINIIGEHNGEMLFKYRQARNKEDLNRIFSLKLADGQAWLPDDFSSSAAS